MRSTLSLARNRGALDPRRRALPVLLLLIAAGLGFGKEKPPGQYAIPLPPAPDFSGLEWLVGNWSGKTTDRSASGAVRLSVTLDLDKRFLVLRGDLALSATKTAPASQESWLGILSPHPSGQGFVLRMFSSTGFVSRYRVILDGPEVRFDPEGGEQPPPGWLFRRVLLRTGPGELTETVQAAPPSRPFFSYYTAKLTRDSAPEKPAPAR